VNRRREHPVAVEQGRAEEARRDEERLALAGPRAAEQRGECEHSPFAVVVGAEDQPEVLDRDHGHERPEHERQDPQHLGLADPDAWPGAKHSLRA
jgi:hypothetical protein